MWIRAVPVMRRKISNVQTPNKADESGKPEGENPKAFSDSELVTLLAPFVCDLDVWRFPPGSQRHFIVKFHVAAGASATMRIVYLPGGRFAVEKLTA